MTKPEVTDEKLDKLLKCLVKEFVTQHGVNTYHLKEKTFYITDRMNCCKEAGLNYEYQANSRDGDVLTVMSSNYMAAVKELAYRGLVEFTGSQLTFVLTSKGYNAGINEESTRWTFLKRWANEHQGLIALIGLVLAFIVAINSYLS